VVVGFEVILGAYSPLLMTAVIPVSLVSGVVVTDEQGQPVRPAILWSDSRAVAEADDYRAASGSFGASRARSCRPEPQRDQNAVDWAVGMLAARLAVDVAVAADRLSDAACRAGLPESLATQLLIDLLDPP
jgi:hypothetical protein